jgi:translocation and assembly module TamA
MPAWVPALVPSSLPRLLSLPSLPLLAMAVALSLGTAGCSSLSKRPAEAPQTDAAVRAKEAAGQDTSSAPVLQLKVDAPSPLDDLLGRHLSLARVNQQAAGQKLNDGELERLVDAAPAEARALLETEGYFEAVVSAEIQPADPPRVQVRVQPGPRVVVGLVDLKVDGPAGVAADDGQPQALEARTGLRQAWPLPAGVPFRDPDWGRAKTASLARFRAQGYVDAQWLDTLARVDIDSHRADLSGTLQSGPLHRAGELRIRGLKHHDAETVRNLADYEPGTPATEDFLLDFQERLQRSGLFERATVTLARNPPDPAANQVNVRLTERPLQDATVGVGVSANLGPQVTLDHVHRRPFGRALLARNRFDIASKRQLWEGEVSTHTLPQLYRHLIGGALSRERSDTDTVASASLRVGRAQETGNISRLMFLQFEQSRTDSQAGRDSASALGLHYHGIWRKLDDNLSPTRGHVWTGQVAAGQARSDPGGNGPFTRLYARLNTYRPIGSWFGQARVELGQVVSEGDVRVPESLRFRAGGDESVRGYAYRSLAPMEQGVLVSGRVLFTASAELARPIAVGVPGLMGAVFVDAGRAARRWSEVNPALGYGVGVRYGSPVGQLKLDLAWGQEVHKLRLHLTVGVPF